jgi:hypothetical protein
VRVGRIRRGCCVDRRRTSMVQLGCAGSCLHVYGHNITYNDSPFASGPIRPGG